MPALVVLPGALCRRFLTLCGILCMLIGAHLGATPLDMDKYQPPGMFIGVGNHHLHLRCTGSGSPAVVFDSGLGGTSLDWVKVQPEVAKFTRVCSYDRGGYGWSSPGPFPRTSERLADELDKLLVYGSVAPPYILVGHSFGGLTMRLFAAKHPGKVAGVVFVDSAHEHQFERFAQAGIRTLAPGKGTLVIANHYEVPPSLPDEVRPIAQALALGPHAIATLYNELRNMRLSAGQVGAQGLMPDVPMVVLARDDAGARAGRAARLAAVWYELQRELAAMTSRGELRVAKDAGHYIQLEQPDAVVGAIREVVQAAR